MGERESLLRAILEDPHDDAARLVYADWLQDQPSEADRGRGELIALQCRLADEEPGYELDWSRDVTRVHDNSANPAVRRAADLCRRAVADEALTPFRAFAGSVWRRGFAETITLEPDDVRRAARLFSAHPATNVRAVAKWPDSRDGLWVWERDEAQYPFTLTAWLYEELRGGEPDPALEGQRPYPSEADALDAYSLACVALGRRLAGLPPLTWPGAPGVTVGAPGFCEGCGEFATLLAVAESPRTTFRHAHAAPAPAFRVRRLCYRCAPPHARRFRVREVTVGR